MNEPRNAVTGDAQGPSGEASSADMAGSAEVGSVPVQKAESNLTMVLPPWFALRVRPNYEKPVAAADTTVSAHPHTTKSVAASPALPVSKRERGPFDPITAEDLATMPQGMSPAAVALLFATAAIFLVAGLIFAAYA